MTRKMSFGSMGGVLFEKGVKQKIRFTIVDDEDNEMTFDQPDSSNNNNQSAKTLLIRNSNVSFSFMKKFGKVGLVTEASSSKDFSDI